MKVWLSMAQAGNRSGTGRYTEELARGLAVCPGLELTAAPGHAWGKLIGPGTGHDVLHFPANFVPAFRAPSAIVTIHDVSFLRHPEWFAPSRAAYYRAAFAITRRKAARFIADSHATKRDLVDLAGIREERIDVVHLGIGPGFRRAPAHHQDAVREKYRLPWSFFLYVGTLEPRKNLPRLLAAFDIAAQVVPQDLVIAGREGWKVAGVREALAEMRFAERVHFPGFVPGPELPALLSAAHGFVWPSLFEGFGLPPLEALACGVPVLTSNTSSLPELLAGHAVLVEPESVDDIARGIRALAEGGSAARDASVQHAQSFTWERTVEGVVASYQRL